MGQERTVMARRRSDPAGNRATTGQVGQWEGGCDEEGGDDNEEGAATTTATMNDDERRQQQWGKGERRGPPKKNSPGDVDDVSWAIGKFFFFLFSFLFLFTNEVF